MRIMSIASLVVPVCAFVGGWYVSAQDTSLPPLPQFSSGQVLTAADLNIIVDHIKEIEAKLEHLQLVSGELNGLKGPHLIFEGVNVHVRSGAGSTNDGTSEEDPATALTGLGNLVIGYNETLDSLERNGSHNLVVGSLHAYSSWGGFVAGLANSITAPSASVSGGHLNTAAGNSASVSGGVSNTAEGEGASVSGGLGNRANGVGASVSGGELNRADCEDNPNTAIEERACTVSGGASNEARGQAATVSGGEFNEASERYASVSGGQCNLASGRWSSISGGGDRSANCELAFGNEARSDLTSISGGRDNTASAEAATVSGGISLEATTIWAHIP
jgi:hypothetical protein